MKKDNKAREKDSIRPAIWITEWFDPYNNDHLRAWDHLATTGTWPEGFIPKHVVLTPNWQVKIAFAMAKAWVEDKAY